MALVKTESMQGLAGLPALRQVGVMLGLAASVALGVAVVMWSQTPAYSLLYGSLSDKEVGEVIEALDRAGISYKVDEGSGALMVPSGEVHKARLQLASDGLPRGGGAGFELLEKEQGFGTSQFLENARYQHALEGELARTIGTLRNVEAARVHLALPKHSVFIRRQEAPSASVVLNLFAGRTLEEGQVSSIVHLVASSVPRLEAGRVTVVDQRGNLLTGREYEGEMGATSGQFAYTRKVEESYGRRIRDLLEPLVGAGGVRAQVVADLDFTVTERTQELYNPDTAVLRSEQLSEEQGGGDGGTAMGVPGTLSGQVPGAPPTPGRSAAQEAAEGGAAVESVRPSSRRITRNYELDKTISHTRLASGTVRRLSVAVVVDDKQVENDDGELERVPWEDAEIERFTRLVREAVGFNEARGDSVNIVNASFQVPPEAEPLPEPPLWEQAWLWSLVKQVAGGIGVLLLVFGVLRPLLRSLAEKAPAPAAVPAGAQGMAEDQLTLSGPGGQAQLAAPGTRGYEERLGAARNIVQQDPKRVAGVVKSWVGSDG